MRRGVKAAILAAGAALLLAAVALATTQPNFTYQPPKITLEDVPLHDSAEQVEILKDGSKLQFTSEPTGMFLTGDSDPGCAAITSGYRCYREGVERIVVTLGSLEDELAANLGSAGDKIRLTAEGDSGADEMSGGPGRQVLDGGGGGDTLKGGDGDDTLKGGPGEDDCRGGPGDDTLIGCET